MKIAGPSDWNALPMPEMNTTIALGLHFSPEQMTMIRRGVVPREMEDKWFVYWKDGALHFHRSWTGFCVFEVRFACGEQGAVAVEAVVNRDAEQYGSTDDERDAKMVEYLINVLLLRRPAKFPSMWTSKSKAALEQWSVVGRAGLGEHPDDDVN